MIGIELAQEGLGGLVIPEVIREKVLVAYTLNQPKVIRIEPPLVVGEEEVDTALQALERAVALADQKYESLLAARRY